MQATTITLTREGFVDSFATWYKLFDNMPTIQFSYKPAKKTSISVSKDEVIPYPEDIIAYKEAMEDFKHGRNIISLDELKRKYA